MIPLKLKMRNFMCYLGDIPTLDFSGIHTACISGDNGNGKSAIIDAMTWALWGKSRARKSDDDLISLGKEEMEVEFDFAVGKQVYRIIRKHSRPKKATSSGQSILEFQVDQGEGFKQHERQISDNGLPDKSKTNANNSIVEFKPLTGNSISDTQQRIVNVLHMDYDTFINSALILQGRADEFTLKAPAKRAEVLSEILGFSYYDALAQKASDLARAAESERGALESAIGDMTIELAAREQAEADEERNLSELDASTAAIETQTKKFDDLKRQKEALEAKEGELKTIDNHIAESRRVTQHLETEQARHAARIAEFDALLDRRLEIERSYAELTETRRADADMNRIFRDAANLNDRKHKLELRIEVLKQKLMGQRELAVSKIAELEKTIGKLPELKREAQKSQETLRLLERRETEVQSKRQLANGARAATLELKLAAAQLEARAKETDEKIKLLASEGEKCPLCGSEIGEEELQKIRANYAGEIEKCLADLKLRKNEAAIKQRELETIEKEVARLEESLKKERPGIQSRVGVIEKALSDADAANETLAAETETKDEIEQQIARREFAATEEKLLTEIISELSRLSYDEAAHRNVQKRLAELESYAELERRLEEADKLAGAEKEAFIRTAETLREMNTAIEAEMKRRAGLGAELILLPKLRSDTAAAEKERVSLIEAQRRIEAALYAIRAKLERFAELEKRRAEKRIQLSHAAEEEKIYKDLTVAFGKKGVQQMFIEAAIPEIEVEANKLLSRMTDNRMHLKIDTLRQSRRGDALETLDINISDELGTRSYEMYSGGEAFRINFAIRIALSKILARRAGAPLPTLIIDEGFGTQDATGIEKIKEAISAIQDDFERILVITHIEELRDAFPNRITVVKGPAGSTIESS